MGLVASGVSGLLPLPGQAQTVPPGVLFLLDNNESMQDYPRYLPEAFTPGFYPTPFNPGPGDLGGEGSAGLAVNTGCSDPALVAAMSWFDKDSADPLKNGSIVYDNDPTFGSPFFEPNKFYFSRGRRLSWSMKESPYSLYGNDFAGYLNNQGDALVACYGGVGWDFNDYPYGYGDPSLGSPLISECVMCLQSKGWWRGPIVTANTQATHPDQAGPQQVLGERPLPPEAFRKWVLSGRVLNVRPPGFVVARKVLKDVINTAAGTRMGVATFGRDHGWYDPPELLETIRPTCDQSSPAINETALDRPRLRQAVNRVQFRNNERSIGEALFGLGGYFSSQRVDHRWETWFQQPITQGYFGWPGCCSFPGGTYDNPYTGQEGMFWGVASDEWLKPPRTIDGGYGYYIYLPGQPWEGFDTDKSVCHPSQVNATIVVTNGTPYSDNTVPITRMMDILEANGATHPDGSLLTFDPAFPETNPSVGGVNYCDQFQKYPSPSGPQYHTKADCDYGVEAYNWPTGLGVGNKNFMDDVAFFLSHTDLRSDMAGSQSMRTYVVGYGDSSPMLQSIARAGRGTFYMANDDQQLRTAITDALGSSAPPVQPAP